VSLILEVIKHAILIKRHEWMNEWMNENYCHKCKVWRFSFSLFFVHFIFSMSAIDFYCSVDKIKGVDGKDRVVVTFDGKYLPHSEQVSFFLFLFSVRFWSTQYSMIKLYLWSINIHTQTFLLHMIYCIRLLLLMLSMVMKLNK